MFWNAFVSVFRKEVLHMLRDGATIRFALAIPIFQLLLFGSIDQTVRHVPTVVVDQDRSSASRAFIDKLEATGTFDVTHLTSRQRAARDDLAAGRARVGVVVPPDFHRDRARGEGAQVLVLIDGSDSTVSAQALAAVNGLVAQANVEAVGMEGRALPLSAQPIILYNPDGRTANFIIPGLVAILMQLSAIALAATAIVRERERGTLEQLLVSPIDPLALILGKLAPYLVFGLGQMAMILALMRYAFGVPIRGSVLFLFVMAVVYLFCLLSLALFISARARTQNEAFQMSQLFVLPSIFLSGYIFPFSGLPVALQAVGLMFPATHMIRIMRGVVLREATFEQLLPSVAALVVMSVVLVFFSARSFRKVAG
jgi:ABC-2 type transport system permease protein